jgi:hypothetical protein
MAEVEWQTNIDDISIEKIFALSDIHGDMHALIIALRDCAKVIKKKEGSVPTNINMLDMETEQLLEYDLNEKEPEYIDDLNYEWCVSNNRVVICGDIIDPMKDNLTNFRKGGVDSKCPQDTLGNTTGCIASEYPQIEIKLYRFINALNRQANDRHNNCRIHKVLGNHEIVNMTNDPHVLNEVLLKKIAPYTISLGTKYYQGISRLNYFNYGNPGFDLIFEGGAGIFLKINNNIFVHGQLDHNLSYGQYDKYNMYLNTPSYPNMRGLLKTLTVRSHIDQASGINNETLFGRNYNREFLLIEKTNKYGNDQHKKCIDVKENLAKILRDAPSNSRVNIDNIRIIVGHCPQSVPRSNVLNSSFTDYESYETIEVLYGSVRTSLRNPRENFVFGIGMECDKTHLDDKYNGYEEYIKELLERVRNGLIPRSDISNYISNYKDTDNNPRYIYKVDVGASRGFDNRNYSPNNILEEKLTYGSRVPQVLEIDRDDNIRIIRSTIKNMRIHQPREVYETNIIERGISELNIENPYYTSRVAPIPATSSPHVPTISILSQAPVSEPSANRQQLESIQNLDFYETQAKLLNTSVGKYAEAYKHVTTQLKKTDNTPITEQDYIKERDRQIKEYIITGGPHYQMKYMKYKLKYLQLKKL